MEAWASFLSALLDLGLRLLEKADADRAAEFRSRVASDGAGVLLGQLNPGCPDAPRAGKSAKGDAGRKSGRMDEQR